MALMFSRLAHNFVKNGYFPTDEVTMGRILQALDAPVSQRLAILDPCCGEGAALAEVQSHLEELGAEPESFGVEYNAERANNARQWLDHVAHADIAEMAIKVRQFGLLFLNPPYGDMVSDQAQLDAAATGGKKRLEKHFYRLAHPWLMPDGVLILIVPHYVFDAEFAALIAKSYRDVRMFMAPEQQFKQCVIFGIKRKSDRLDPELAEQLQAMSTGKLPPELPEHWAWPCYQVPACVLDNLQFVAHRIEPEGLAHELERMQRSTLWPQFEQHFGGRVQPHRRPLRALRDWHLALALAAGQISGVVRSSDGRILLVKGDTHKNRALKVTFEESGKAGEMREVRTLTDKFVPVIRAIEFTPGPMFGNLVTIQ